jgi:hypothetical protein
VSIIHSTTGKKFITTHYSLLLPEWGQVFGLLQGLSLPECTSQAVRVILKIENDTDL